ncbi:DedA family protein [Thalassiella azotivora]
MGDELLDLATNVAGSPWLVPVLVLMAAADAVVPMVPSETAVVTAGALAASGPPSLPLVVLAASAGALLGDHGAYLLGRLLGPRVPRRLAGARDVAARALRARGGAVIVLARYVPGGRGVVTVTAGATGYPLRRFTPFALLAALSWGTYCGLVGYLGGLAFADDPVRGVLLGVGLALVGTVVVEVALRLRARRARRRAAPPDAAPAPASPVDDEVLHTVDNRC